MNSTKTSPRDVFMQLLGIITLYFATFSFGTLLFQYINIYFPDVLTTNHYRAAAYRDIIRWALATIVIVFPVYLWVSRFLLKEEEKFPKKREMRSRKWLLHFTVFAAAGVIIGDLVSLVYNYLQGELTTRFVLKILTVLITAAAVFGYYLWLLRQDNKTAANRRVNKKIKVFVWSVIVVVTITAVAGFFIAGSPQKERLRRLDQERINDLQNIQSQIIFFWQQKGHLPNNLNDLRDNISGYTPPSDPETDTAYDYEPLDDLKFKLCANFQTESEEDIVASFATREPMPIAYPIGTDNWRHKSGLVCFERTIDPTIWKPVEK